MAFCSNCGANLPDGTAYCTQCGVAVSVANAQPQNTVQTGYYQQPTQPTQLTQSVQVPVGYQPKSKLAAGLLGIFLGSLGVHNFYLGYTGKAVAQLLISLLSLGLFSGVSYIWGLVEGIMLLTGSIAVDGKNVPLVD